jgi:hypothetical protein
MKSALASLPSATVYRLTSRGRDEDGGDQGERAFVRIPSEISLPFKIELWDADKASVERVLAITADGSIGYGAYYAAAREFPDRYITLRDHDGRIISRWNPPEH